MRIVIDIPEDEYELVRHGNKSFRTELELMNAVAKGIPLPKGHGDLKDADRLLDGFFYEYCRYGDFGYRQAENLIKNSLTVIKADKEEE